MLKKGKFKLLSYILDENLIFYKSLNRNKKYLGFFGLQAKSFYPLIPILNNFLNKRFIKYYSIQINTKKVDEYFYFINIENNTKNETIKLWNLIKEKIVKKNIDITFLNRKTLEKAFLDILDDKMSNNSFISKNSNLMLIRNNNNVKSFEFYQINFENLEDKIFFLESFLNYINNLSLFGYLILNFQLNINNFIKISAYFTTILENAEIKVNLLTEVNNFFNTNLLEKKDVGIKYIGLFLWRYPLFNNFYSFKELSDLFKTNLQHDFKDIQQFNRHFEQALIKNQIKHKRINENMVFIFNDILFITFFKSNPNLLLKIFKKYYSRYLIYLLVFNEIDHDELLRMEINLLKNVNILNIDEYLELDPLVFKKKMVKKYPN